MTPEAALTKLSYLLGRKDYNMKQKKEVTMNTIGSKSKYIYM